MAASSLNLEVKDDIITNVREIKETLNNITMNDDIVGFLETIVNHLKYNKYVHSEELLEALTAKIIEYKNEVKSNQESLRQLQEYNDDFKRLSIVTTRSYDNDSGKDIDYITFKNKYGEVEVLACQDSTTISNFIKDNASGIATKSAEEIFHHFKEYVHINLNFQTNEELMKNDPELDKSAKNNDELSKTQEINELEEYKRNYSLPYDVELTVDQYGERLYRVGDGLFKFKDFEGKRKMIVLQTPTMMLTEDEDLTTDITVSVDKEVEETKEEVSLDDIELISDEQFINLLYSKYDLEQELTEEEELQVYKFVAYIVNKIDEEFKINDLDPTVREYFEKYIKKIEEKYNNRNFEENEITPEQEKLVEEYRSVKEIAYRNVKKLELLYDERRAGVASAVIIMEIIIIAIFVLSFISLDI